MRKYIAPIIIGLIMILYFSTIGIMALFSSDLNLVEKLLITFIPLCLSCISIYVMLQRIKEIKGGEEDDARKY